MVKNRKKQFETVIHIYEEDCDYLLPLLKLMTSLGHLWTSVSLFLCLPIEQGLPKQPYVVEMNTLKVL